MSETKRAPWRRMLRLVFVIAGIYAAVVAASAVFYRRGLYPAPRDAGPTPPPGAELRSLVADDGTSVVAVHFRAPPGARTLVHFHGNGETLRGLVTFGQELHRRGLGVMLVEYRGYGSSPGSPTEEGLYLDAKAALDALEKEGSPADRIVLSGTSLGTGVAAEMASRGRGAALVLITPYTSIPAVAQWHVKVLPMSLVMRDRFDTLSKVAKIKVPALVIHGDDDEIVPYEMGRELALRLPSAELVTVPGGRHNDLFSRDGSRLLSAIVAHATGEATASAR